MKEAVEVPNVRVMTKSCTRHAMVFMARLLRFSKVRNFPEYKADLMQKMTKI